MTSAAPRTQSPTPARAARVESRMAVGHAATSRFRSPHIKPPSLQSYRRALDGMSTGRCGFALSASHCPHKKNRTRRWQSWPSTYRPQFPDCVAKLPIFSMSAGKINSRLGVGTYVASIVACRLLLSAQWLRGDQPAPSLEMRMGATRRPSPAQHNENSQRRISPSTRPSTSSPGATPRRCIIVGATSMLRT